MSEKKKIDPNSTDYSFSDIEQDPRFIVCKKEMFICFGIFVVFAVAMLLVVYVVGGGDPAQYNYILGMPAWYFWLFVVCAATAVVIAVLLDKVFKHMSLESEGDVE